jgi:hypothetical protein
MTIEEVKGLIKTREKDPNQYSEGEHKHTSF